MLLLFLMIATGVSACSPDDPSPGEEVPRPPGGGGNPGTDPADPEPGNMKMAIRIGSVDHPEGLEVALGTGNVSVTFEETRD